MALATFKLKNLSNLSSEATYFQVGLPCSKGSITSTAELGLFIDNASSDCIAAYCEGTSYWPDGSIKWLQVRGLSNAPANSEIQYKIASLPTRSYKRISVVKNTDTALLIVLPNNAPDNKSAEAHPDQWQLSKTQIGHLSTPNFISRGLALNGQAVNVIGEVNTSYATRYSMNMPIFVDISQHGKIKAGDKHLDIELQLTICVQTRSVMGEITLRNPFPAQHPNGQWDLGDPNSQILQCITLELDSSRHDVSIAATHNDELKPIQQCQSFTLHQASSGLANWQSPVHVNQENDVDLLFKGYEFRIDNELTSTGKHALPLICLSGARGTVTVDTSETELKIESTTAAQNTGKLYVQIEKFWQNFPASVNYSGNSNTLSLSLLGAEQGPKTELQPGEQKTRKFSISPVLQVNLTAEFCPKYIEETQAIPFFSAENMTLLLHQAIQDGVNGANNFFDKRDAIDEYGWRHFGELYADHEKALTPDEQYFVSHYNNQYDPIYGMLIQWLLTGNEKWFELADDLAQHVADIDIYRTQYDKPDYSGGLFWHTDHYVKAYTATHRTYSKHQPSNVYDDHAGGGGPGGQHCYSMGLLLHYYVTGSQQSKTAVLSLGNWITTLYEGDKSLTGLLLALKNRHRIDLKSVITGKYPLDRGTGNYIQTLLDCYELTANPVYVKQIEHIIYHTVSPYDNILTRGFEDIENTWFYTVFLQSVCRFITVKEVLAQEDANNLDNAYCYAVASLCHYTRWMIESEQAYLETPEKLEFPNQTWSGQDLRKLCVISFATPYLPPAAQPDAEKAVYLLAKNVEERILDSDERQNTRVLCLMMQNYGYSGYLNFARKTADLDDNLPAKIRQPNNPFLRNLEQRKTLPDTLLRQVLTTRKQFSPSYERQQLLKRFPQFSKWFGELNV